MTRVSLLLSLLALLGACGGSGSSTSAAPGATVVEWHIGATGVQTTVKAGTTVQWHSSDEMAHTVTSSDSPSSFAELAVPGGGYSAPTTFSTAGTFPYFCSIHGAKSMSGTLTVTP
jgi:hypothetical protein